MLVLVSSSDQTRPLERLIEQEFNRFGVDVAPHSGVHQDLSAVLVLTFYDAPGMVRVDPNAELLGLEILGDLLKEELVTYPYTYDPPVKLLSTVPIVEIVVPHWVDDEQLETWAISIARGCRIYFSKRQQFIYK